MEQTLALFTQAHAGDKEARDTLVQANTGLVWSIVTRFKNRGAELEDLFQIGSIGLMKAIDRFDLKFEVKFSTYAVPMIMGEIKRYLRDDGMLRVSRTLKEQARHIYHVREELEKELGREPTLVELSRHAECPMEEMVEAMEAVSEVESLQKVIYQGEGNEISLMDKLEEPRNSEENLLNRLMIEQIWGLLTGQERKLIYMRYFQEKTQSEIARELGMTQVQVSRMEKKILLSLRNQV
ncbi:MAG: SigB/SigF/SigG family RNA polymerase sigma factor [Lachnospiraceae bacterium]|nr:SigB/SigF/SigG family RNA polymerase sigma factor [Lachnospiraceae bacterium]